jgi:hypothetical protein
MVAAAPATDDSFVHRVCYTVSSVQVFQWPRPDGPPDQASSWASTTRMLNSWRMHWGMSGGRWPRGEVSYRRPAAYLPDPLPSGGIRFDQLVDHLSRTLLGRTTGSRLLRAACEGVDVAPEELITPVHGLVRWQMPRLIAVLLDSPTHMTR